MRHTYELSDETRKTLTNNVPFVAEEMNVTVQHLYAVLANSYTDPFAVFLHWYEGVLRAGLSVKEWDNRMERAKAKYAGICTGNYSIADVAATFTREAAEVPASMLSDSSLYEQLSEVCDALQCGERLKRTILRAINEEKASENAARTRVNGTGRVRQAASVARRRVK